MQNNKGSALAWILISIVLIALVLIAIFVIIPLLKPAKPIQLPISVLGAPFGAYSSTLQGDSITIEVQNQGTTTATIQSFHLTFTSPTTASCDKELVSPITIAPNMISPIKLEGCKGFDIKKEKLDATVSIGYKLEGNPETKSASGSIGTFGPIQ